MMSRKVRVIVAVLFLATLFTYRHWERRAEATPAEPAPVQPVMLGQLAFTPCSLSVPMSRDTLAALCTTFEVPEDRATPEGRKIPLHIAWLEASDGNDTLADPVFFLAGGPGQSAVETYPALDPVFREVRRQRNVILVDQRGTGKSNPLHCQSGAEEMTGSTPEALQAMRSMAAQCAETLSARADLRFYTTSDAVADLDVVRAAIGAQQINLVGLSYGTRVAQQYAMRYPGATRSIVLDSVVPNALELGNIIARNLDEALALQFGLCTKDPLCREQLGDPRAELDALLATLRVAPPTVRYRDATTGEWKQGVLHAGTVAGLVRMYAYLPLASALLPKLIHEANAGHHEGLMALAGMLADNMKDAMAMGMQLSVICSEDAGGMVAREDDTHTVLGNAMPQALAAMCAVWPKGAMPADFHDALATQVPALLLEGEFDPITPPRYGEEVLRSLPGGRLFVLRGQGHGVLGAGCMPKLFTQFIEKAEARVLDGQCLERLGYVAPFTSFNGAGP